MGNLRFRTAWTVGGVAALVVLTALSGCQPAPAPTGGRVPPTGDEPLVTVLRTGGFAGVNDRIEVRANGRWSKVDRAGVTRTGQLSPGQLERLTAAVRDPDLAGEKLSNASHSSCRDAYNYAVTVGALTVSYVDCPTDAGRPRRAMAIVAEVLAATG